MDFNKLFVGVWITILLVGCSKSTPKENVDLLQNPAATDLVLMSPIGPVSKAGDVVQLREKNANACDYFGSLTPHFAIAVERKRCGDIVGPASFVLPLSRTHTYADVDGKLRSGYGAGDRFVVRLRSNNP